MKPVDVKSNTYIDWSKEINDKDPDNIVRISKHENIFAKDYVPNWPEEVFVIKKVKNTAPWTYVISDFNGEKFFGTFNEKELQKINQKVFRVDKVRKKNGDKLYVKWKGKDSSFNCWIDKKDIVWVNIFQNWNLQEKEWKLK